MTSAIVCIDDEFEILKSIGEQLKRRFGEQQIIELAQSGDDALELCQELREDEIDIAVIISDQNMAGMDGDELLIRLHQLYPHALKIMLTGEANAEAVGNIVNHGALYRFISKPWNKTDLLMTVAEAIRRFEQDSMIKRQNELLQHTNAKLENSLSLLLATLDATADAILVLDQAGTVLIYNQQFRQLWDVELNSSAPIDQDILTFISAKVQNSSTEFLAALKQTNSKEKGYLSLEDFRVVEYYTHPQNLAGESVGIVVSFRDVTLSKKNEALMQKQAFHDPLTQLPNRLKFDQVLFQHLQSQTPSFALLFLDLDRFKWVNDTFGHAMGDLLLKKAVERLSNCLREHDCLARWGGDEFVLLLANIQNRQQVNAVSTRLIQALQEPFQLQNHEANVTTSIGITLCPQNSTDAKELLQQADIALYAAKNAGKNTHRYFDELKSYQAKPLGKDIAKNLQNLQKAQERVSH